MAWPNLARRCLRRLVTVPSAWPSTRPSVVVRPQCHIDFLKVNLLGKVSEVYRIVLVPCNGRTSLGISEHSLPYFVPIADISARYLNTSPQVRFLFA